MVKPQRLGATPAARRGKMPETAKKPCRIAEATIAGWDRARMLPRLIAIAPEEVADDSREGHRVVVGRLVRALRGERERGRAGHWSYSLDRHFGLVLALAAERRHRFTAAEADAAAKS